MKRKIIPSGRGGGGLMRKVSQLLFLSSLFFLFTFNSCNNLFENSVSSSEEENTSTSEEPAAPADRSGPIVQTPTEPASGQVEYFQFGGSLQVSGAVPAQLIQAQQNDQESSGRSANPTIPNDQTLYEYYVRGVSTDGLVRESTIPANSSSINYNLQLETRKTWTITAGLRRIADSANILIDYESDSGNPYILSLTDTTLIDLQPKTFILKPLQTNGGAGTIDLTMTAPQDASITLLKLFRTGADGTAEEWNPDELEFSTTYIRTKTNMTIASGSYEVTMIFYRHDGNLNTDFQAFITYQTINVFDGMHTSVWVNENASGTDSVISGNTFQVTNALVQKFASSVIYVGAMEGISITPNDSYSGSPYAPLSTLGRAFEIIQTNTGGDGNTRDYRIFVSTAAPLANALAQPQQDNLIIPGGSTGITSSQAKSIEIIGLGSGANQATLNPSSSSPGTVLTVNTVVPVKLRNIKITGGNATNGGGIKIGADANVTLEAGTIVGASGVNAAASGANDCGNYASQAGGGIYCEGELTLKSGSVVGYNYVADDGNAGQGGGGIFCNGGTVNVQNGAIVSYNGAQHHGAGIAVNSGTVNMSAGELVSNNGNAVAVTGTGTFNLGGSARIPYGVGGQTGTGKNDVYLATDKVITLGTDLAQHTESAPVAITATWARQNQILTLADSISDKTDVIKKFSLTAAENDGWEKKLFTNIVKLDAPIYVGGTSDTGSGIRSNPYKTFAEAITYINGLNASAVEYTIRVTGTTAAVQQTISGTIAATAINIEGYGENPTIDRAQGNSSDPNGTALVVSTTVPVTIKNLKITGGNKSSGNNSDGGGGLKVASGACVTIGDGVVISGNKGSYGGGVYVGSNAKFFMYGSALIGDLNEATATGTASCSNWAWIGAGIYSIGGNVYIGYDGITGTTPHKCDMTSGYGVRRNYASGQTWSAGAGICNIQGKVYISSGTISYNQSEVIGGGIYTDGIESAPATITIDTPVADANKFTMYANQANMGGAINNGTYTTLTMNAGQIGGAGNLQNTATTSGGAIYQGAKFQVGGAALIYPGSNKINDVYLPNGNFYVIAGSSIGNSASAKMSLSPQEYKRGKKIILGDGVEVNETLWNKFQLTQDDADWTKQLKTEGTGADQKNYVAINSPVYVAGTGTAAAQGRVLCSAGMTKLAGATGTKSNPFSTIAEALEVFEDSTSPAEITIDGEVTGGQTIGGTGVTINASQITIQKITATGGSGKLNGSFTNESKGSTLTIDTNKLVKLSGLEITGGYSATNGGGINIVNTSAMLTLDNVKIQGNYATDNGGGIYIPSGAKVAGYGSGFIIGNENAAAPAGTGTALNTGINKAANGGGIYSAGDFYLGGEVQADGSFADIDGLCSIYANVAEVNGDGTGNGGGIYSSGTLQLKHGNVKYNYASTNGGAVYNGGNDLVLLGDTILYDTTNAEKTNDIYLAGSTKIKLRTYQNNVNGTNPVATITPSSWTRGKKVLAKFAGLEVNLTAGYSKFEISDSEWNVGYYVSGTPTEDLAARIGADIWVAGTYNSASLSSDVGSNVTGGSAPSNDNRGTKKKPYADIATAVAACWDEATTKNVDFTINIDGTVGGAQTIGSGSAIKAKSITLQGHATSGASAATLHGQNTSGNTTLTVNAGASTFPVTIKDLKITGGNNTNGGGINITKGTVILTDGSVVTGNQANNGGGVYVAGANARLLMNGKALIGDSASSVTTAESTNSTTYANTATDGAGIYAAVYGNVYLGYSLDSNGELTTTNSALISNATNGYYGVRRNYATGKGGGIYTATNDLKIDSGNVSYNQAGTGGGIYFSAATSITACSIDGNKAQEGGGIYIASNTGITLKSVSMTSNKAIGTSSADAKGGAVYNKGSLTLYDVTSDAVSMTSNQAVSSSQNAYGGAIYNPYGGSVNINGAATINNNQATTSGTNKTGYGGAIYNEGLVEIKKGNIGSTNPNTATSAGGAIYQSGNSCKIGGTNLSFNSGSAKSNDIYIVNSKPLTVTDTLPTGAQIAITPWSFVRGNKLIMTSETYADELAKFTVTKPADVTTNEWRLYKPFVDGSNRWARLDADLWVASVGTSTGRASTVNAPPDSGRNGTKAKPYATIDEALGQIWDDGTSKTVDFTVNISGSLTGGELIAESRTKAKSIKLLGDANADKTEIDGNNEARTSSLLTINTAVPVTIQNLTIKNGNNTSGSGGGISVSAAGASLTLSTGAVVSGNTTSGNGGGIYIAGTDAAGGTANLIMNSTATVSSNSAGTHNGGGVYLENANLCMSGKALIGDTDVTGITYLGGNSSNSAARGGGVYCSTGSKIYLGCNTSGDTSSGGVSYELSPGYGICHNYGTYTGGGVDLRGSMTIKSGSVSYNATRFDWAGSDGGGIWQASGTTIEMSGGTIAKNKADKGGGVYAGGSFTMTGGTIGDSSNTINSPATNSTDSQSNSASYGGGIYAPSGASVSISGGYINYNYANNGGGIYWEGSTLIVTDGNISYNYGSYGGGICFKSGATLTKATFTKNNASSGGALYIASGNEVTVNGAAAFTGNTASNGGAVSNNGTFKLTGGATFNSNSATTSGGAVHNYGAFTMSGSASISAGSGAKNNDIGLESGKTIVTDGLTTTGVVGLVTPSSYYENRTVITKGSNCSDTQFKVDTGKFVVTPNGTEQWSVDATGKLVKGITANGIAAFLSNKAANIKTSPYDLQITVSTASAEATNADITAISEAIKNGGRFVNVTFTNSTLSSLPEIYAFSYCTYLTGITLPEGLTSIPQYSFYSCSNLTSVTLPNSVTTLGASCFADCSSLASIEFPSGFTGISSFAFTRAGLTSVTIPASVTSFSGMGFTGCSKLESFTVESGNSNYKSVSGVVYSKDGKKIVAIPTGKTGDYTIASGTEEINRYCCCSGKLTSVTIPASVTKIGDSAFTNCLTSINFQGTMEQWNSVTKASGWYENLNATYVTCTDGWVALN